MSTVRVDEQLRRRLHALTGTSTDRDLPEDQPTLPAAESVCLAAAGGDPTTSVETAALMVLAAVRDGDPATRAAMADALADAEPRWLIGLDAALRQRWRWVPYWSQTTAAMLADDGDSSLDVLRLVAAAAHHDGHLREAAVIRLATVDHPAALAALALRAGDWVPQVRDAARQACRRWWAPAADPSHLAAVAGLAFALRARRNGAWLAEQIEHALPQLPAATLQLFLAATDRRTRRAAYGAAIATGRLQPHRLLAAADHDPDPVIRTMCARAVIAAAADPDTIRALLTSRTALVRAEALHTVATDGAHIDDIVRALADRHPLVRTVAQTALTHAGIDPAEHYWRLITRTPPTPAVIAGLGETGTSADADLIRRWLAHDRARGRAAAIRALRRLGAIDPAELTPLLRDPSGTVTRQAVAGLRPHSGSIPCRFLEALLQPANPPHVRVAGYRLLAAGDPWLRLITDLQLIDDPDPRLLATARADIGTWLNHEAATAYQGPRPDQAAALERRIEHARPVLGSRRCALLRFHAGLATTTR